MEPTMRFADYAKAVRIGTRLTERETDVLVRLAAGLSNAAIGADLGTTEKTVKNVLLPIGAKMGADNDDGRNLRVTLTLSVLAGFDAATRESFLSEARTFGIAGLGA